MNKLTTIIISLIIIVFIIIVVILQKNNSTKNNLEKENEIVKTIHFDCPYIEKNIGEEYSGGVIAYCDKNGRSGLIATHSDQSINAPWGCNGVYIDNTSSDYNTGKSNTNLIVKKCTEKPIAASVCQDLGVGRYEDWFLPSLSELNYLYINKNKIGNFSNSYYWSSTENNFASAMRQSFNLGVQNSSSKSGNYRVRCVRYF